MKKRVSAFMVACLLGIMFANVAWAASKDLNNWYAIRATDAGEHYLMDKYYNPVIEGDAKEHDGTIVSFRIEAEGFNAATDKLYAIYDNGPAQQISVGLTTVSGSPKNVSIKLVRSGTAAPVMVKLTKITVNDASAPEPIEYTYSASVPADWTGDISIVKDVNATHYYASFKDEYRVDYDKLSDVSRYELHYLDSNGNTLYKRDYEQPPTGIHWLTCNGIYEMRFFDSTGTMTGKTKKMPTNQISSPTCASYDDNGGTGSNPLNGKRDNENLKWDADPRATKYEIWKDGQKIGETSDTHYENVGKDGSITIVGKDNNGNTVVESDVPKPSTDPGPDPGGNCGDVCQKLREVLDCPEWDTYMGELTNAIRNAFDWPSIADVFIGKLADYLGDVPAPPSKEEIAQDITPDVPGIDTSVPEANIRPDVPDEFDNGPIDYDITTGPQIPVVDESQPIEIYEPDEFINSDNPGDMVFPNDPRNSSDGIKQPDAVDTGTTTPIPTKESDHETPPAELPKPNPSTGTTPKPEASEGIIPIPKDTTQ